MSALHIAEQEDPVQFALPPYAEQPLRLDQQLKMYWKTPKFKKLVWSISVSSGTRKPTLYATHLTSYMQN